MELVFGHDQTVAGWVEQHYGFNVSELPAWWIGVIDNEGYLKGAFAVHKRSGATAELGVYGKTSNGAFKGIFNAIFSEFTRLEVRTHPKNRAIKKAAPKFGFRFQAVEKGYYAPGEDAVVYWMDRDSCRWLQ